MYLGGGWEQEGGMKKENEMERASSHVKVSRQHVYVDLPASYVLNRAR